MSNIPRMMMLAGASAAASKRFSGVMDLFKDVPDNECAWFDPSDFSTMFQDINGTIPVTAVGQPVALMLDKSKGLESINIKNGIDLNVDQISLTSGTTIDSSSKFTTTGAGGLALTNILKVGSLYRLEVSVSISVNSFRILNSSGTSGADPEVFSSVGGATTTSFIATKTGLYFRNSAAATTEILNFKVVEIKGNHAFQSTASARPTLQVDNKGLHYLDFDGVDDTMTVQPNVLLGTQPFVGVGTWLPPLGTGTSRPTNYIFKEPGGSLTSTTSNLLVDFVTTVDGPSTEFGSDVRRNVDPSRTYRVYSEQLGAGLDLPSVSWVRLGVDNGVLSRTQDKIKNTNLKSSISPATLYFGLTYTGSVPTRYRLYQFIWTNKELTDQQLANVKKFLAAKTYAPFDMMDLFQNDEQGVWYDPSDMSTLFQDAAGTIPVTEFGQPVGLMLDKSPNANHAIQATATRRPIYTRVPAGGVRNIINNSNNGLVLSGVPLAQTQAGILDSDGGYEAVALWGPSTRIVTFPDTPVISAGMHVARVVFKRLEDTTRNLEFYMYNASKLKAASTTIVLSINTLQIQSGHDAVISISDLPNGYIEIIFKTNVDQPEVGQSLRLYVGMGAGLAPSNWGIIFHKAQLEAGEVSTPHQTRVSQYDVTEAGVPDIYGLTFDGVDDVQRTVFGFKPSVEGSTVAACCVDYSLGSGSQYLFSPGTTDGVNLQNFRSGGTSAYFNGAPQVLSTIPYVQGNKILVGVSEATLGDVTQSIRSHLSSSAEVTGSPLPDTTRLCYIGAYATTNYFKGLFTGLVAVSRPTTKEETTLLMNYLNKNTRAF